eukprot:TRINITY_DN28101_c0_g1_i1.p1 TRINITY_DN28101_c0_g1~~TRINITY_DN28101_c0_g1_i1.p1  ORF type:complete len:242 (-),score=65.77 TRINITY_DN28101_c0_g1_i1:180-905(-)
MLWLTTSTTLFMNDDLLGLILQFVSTIESEYPSLSKQVSQLVTVSQERGLLVETELVDEDSTVIKEEETENKGYCHWHYFYPESCDKAGFDPFLKLNLLDLDPLQFARQLCLIDNYNISSVPETDLHHSAWTKKVDRNEPLTKNANAKEWNKNKTRVVGSLAKVFQGMNNLSYWFAEQVLKEDNPLKRAEVLEQILRLGKHLISLNNYNSLMTVYLSVEIPAVARLKKTWRHVCWKKKHQN